MADFNKIVKQLEDKNKANKDRGTQLSDQKNVVQSLDAVQNAIVRSIAVLIQTMIEDTQKVEITNHKDQLDTIKTPDAIQGAKMVEYCIKDLQRVVQNKDVDLSGVLTHLEGIHGVLEQLPTKYPEMPEYPQEMAVKGLNDLSKKLDGLVAEVKKLKLDPKIDVSTPEVKIDLSKELKQIEEAIQRIDIVIPEYPKTDLLPLLGAMNAVQTAVREIEIPVPNFRGAEIVKAINDPVATLTVRIDDSADPILYIGKAETNSEENDPVWQIAKLDTSAGMSKTWAGEADFNFAWSNRTTINYS